MRSQPLSTTFASTQCLTHTFMVVCGQQQSVMSHTVRWSVSQLASRHIRPPAPVTRRPAPLRVLGLRSAVLAGVHVLLLQVRHMTVGKSGISSGKHSWLIGSDIHTHTTQSCVVASPVLFFKRAHCCMTTVHTSAGAVAQPPAPPPPPPLPSAPHLLLDAGPAARCARLHNGHRLAACVQLLHACACARKAQGAKGKSSVCAASLKTGAGTWNTKKRRCLCGWSTVWATVAPVRPLLLPDANERAIAGDIYIVGMLGSEGRGIRGC